MSECKFHQEKLCLIGNELMCPYVSTEDRCFCKCYVPEFIKKPSEEITELLLKINPDVNKKHIVLEWGILQKHEDGLAAILQWLDEKFGNHLKEHE